MSSAIRRAARGAVHIAAVVAVESKTRTCI